MPILTVAELKEQLNLTPDLGAGDDALLGRKLAAAQDHVERLLGYKIEANYPPVGNPPVSTVPPALIEAVSQLAAQWYENREATVIGSTVFSIPFGVEQIIQEYREFSFDG
ncbi:head-tail connector protein [Rhizobium sp. HT1-10]|uniref:head-tail connector protein n=1 Tax=Rhizobium sp. HT1-10 TaxID=3111638 RepID=UPI003C1EBBCA